METTPSLQWIHEIREKHYLETKELPIEKWLKPPDPKKVAQACRRLGIKVKVAPARKQLKRHLL